MGKASSSKKVARVAGTGGGRVSHRGRAWGFTAILAVIVVLGVALSYTSRRDYQKTLANTTAANAKVAPKVGGTPWNEGYAVDICGKWQKPIDHPHTKTGIGTAGDGVIHIAPKVSSAAGKNATLGVFASSVGMTLSGNQIQLPKGKAHLSGNDCGTQPAEVYVKKWAFAGAPSGTILKQDPRNVRLQDQALLTIAFVPRAKESKIPPPPHYVQEHLKKAVAASTTTTTAPTITVPATSSTTAKGSSPATSSPATSSSSTPSSTTKASSSGSTTSTTTGATTSTSS